MQLRITGSALALVLAAAAAAPASAQYRNQPSPPPVPVQTPPDATAAAPKISVSKAALKPIKELQAAVDARDTANIPAKLAAAQAAAKTNEDRHVIAQLQLKAAATANDQAAIRAAIRAMLATGLSDPAQQASLNLNLAKLDYQAKQYDAAASGFEKVLALQPAHSDALVLLAETRKAQNRTPDAISLLQRAIQARTAAGQKADESWYKRAVGLAYDARLPSSVELARMWVAAYPSAESWRDALRIYRNLSKPDEATTLDTLRLARLTGALAGDTDFLLYADNAVGEGAAGEARAVLDEAAAAKQIDAAKPVFREANSFIKSRIGTGQAGLAGLAAEALANPAAAMAVRIGNAHYGYGEYAKAAELYRAALSKSGANADLINFRLGMALARSGDKAGAAAAFKAVSGPRAELAKYWLAYVGAAA